MSNEETIETACVVCAGAGEVGTSDLDRMGEFDDCDACGGTGILEG